MAYSFTLGKIPKDFNHKTVDFYLHTESRRIYAQPVLLNKEGYFYWPVCIFDKDEISIMYKFCMHAFEKMQTKKLEETTDKINLINIANVKTYIGAVRKFEFFSFNHDSNEYIFCKGERGLLGFTTYSETLIGEEINEELFTKAHQKRMKKLIRKLDRKDAKKRTQENS